MMMSDNAHGACKREDHFHQPDMLYSQESGLRRSNAPGKDIHQSAGKNYAPGRLTMAWGCDPLENQLYTVHLCHQAFHVTRAGNNNLLYQLSSSGQKRRCQRQLGCT